MRIQFEIPSDQLETLDELQKRLGLKTRTELFNNSMTLLQWAARHAENGQRISVYDEDREVLKELSMPALDRVMPAISKQAKATEPGLL